MRKSIIHNGESCYLCGRGGVLETHHVVHGSGRRILADQDGLTVKLCPQCHRNLHDFGWNDKDLQKIGMAAWMREYGTKEDFIRRYGRAYE